MKGEYYKTKTSVEEYVQLAKDVSGESLIKKLKTFLPLGSKLLEIGSGTGTDWKILSRDYEVLGSDNSKAFLNHLRSKQAKGVFIELDAISLQTNQKFDAIYSNKVLHHLKDLELSESIDRQYNLLNSNGIICHSFWKGEESEIFKGLFVNYHTQDSLENFFEGMFDILLLEEYAEFEKGDSLLLIAKKK